MKRNWTLILLLLVILVSAALAQSDPGKEEKNSNLSAKKGDLPPGLAKSLSPAIARIIVRDQLQKRHLYSTKAILLTPAYSWLESKNIRVTGDYLSFDYDLISGTKRTTERETFQFKRYDYVHVIKANLSGTVFTIFRGAFGQVINTNLYTWTDKNDAQRMADAVNRLIYEARVVVIPKDDVTSFASDVEKWRSNPDSRPKLPEDFDRHRILAEQAIRDKNFLNAIISFENGVQAYPIWAAGWFNAALLYAELGEYECAANRMKHYLLLVPDAPDAKAAREKVIIWEDKAKN